VRYVRLRTTVQDDVIQPKGCVIFRRGAGIICSDISAGVTYCQDNNANPQSEYRVDCKLNTEVVFNGETRRVAIQTSPQRADSESTFCLSKQGGLCTTDLIKINRIIW